MGGGENSCISKRLVRRVMDDKRFRLGSSLLHVMPSDSS